MVQMISSYRWKDTSQKTQRFSKTKYGNDDWGTCQRSLENKLTSSSFLGSWILNSSINGWNDQ